MISSFKNYLVEEEKTVYFTFGRMNPPTGGHEKLLDILSSKAGRNPHRIYLSQSQDSKKNPLDYITKIKTARKFFPKHARSIILNKKLRNVFDIVTSLFNEGFKNIVMVVGSDRIREFDVLLKKYNDVKGKHGYYNFNTINVISAGDRDPDADDVSGMSASKMRAAAAENNFTAFTQGLPKSASTPDAKKVFNLIRTAMGIKEESNFINSIQFEPVSEEREQYVTGNLFKPGDVVSDKKSGEVLTVKYLGANHVIVEDLLETKTERKWLDAIEKIEELSKSTKDKRDAHFNKNKDKEDDDPSAYKPAPGDARSKTKVSKHTKRFKSMFGENGTKS